MDYLHRRGLTDESIQKFRIGFAPDSFEATYTYLLNKGFTKKLLVSAGLALTKETTVEKIYDRFRERLMFPIRDNVGRIVAFGGRALRKEQEPKYVNSPESPIYHKSNVLYGFFQAKPALKHRGEAVIAEGYFDVIAAHQAGVEVAVAPCGTALASRQLRLLKPFVQSIALAFDNDNAGQEAAKRAYEMAQEFEFVVKMVVIPDGKDPADYVRDHGNTFHELIDSAVPYGDFYYQKLLDTYGTEDIAAKKKILQEFLPFFHFMKSSIEKDSYVRRLALDLDLKEVQIYDEIKNFTLPSYHPARSHVGIDDASASARSAKKDADEILLGLMIEFPRIGKLFVPKIEEDCFSEDLKPIYKAYVDQYNDHGFETDTDLINNFPHALKEKAALTSLYVSEKYGEISEIDVENEISALFSHLWKKQLQKKRKDLQKRLHEAEREGNRTLSTELLKELNQLNAEAMG